MELVEFFAPERVITFMLLFARIGGLMLFFPFYGHEQIPMSVKTAFSFLLTLFLFPLASIKNGEIYYLAVEIVSEAALGVCAGLLLYIVFASLQLAGRDLKYHKFPSSYDFFGI